MTKKDMNVLNKRKSLLHPMLIAAGVTLALSGCSTSTDSSENPSTGTPSTVSGVKLSGAVAKGIISNGVITAEELDVNGSVIRVVGSTKTDAKGDYTLTLGNDYEGGPVRIQISVGSDTLMKCDALAAVGCGTFASGDTNDTNSDGKIDRGEWFAPASSFSMKALVPKANANDTFSVSVTPYTTMAAARALAQGALSSDNIAQANSEVSNLLGGVDVLSTRPVDVTDPVSLGNAGANARVYALMSAAVTSLAQNGALHEAVEDLASSFTSGTIQASQLQAIVDATAAQATASSISDSTLTLVLADLQSDIDSAVDGVVDPVASDTSTFTEIQQVKSFISDLRTWGTTIVLEPEAKANAFEQQAALASDLASGFTDYTLPRVLAAAAEVILKVNPAEPNLSAYVLEGTDEYGFPLSGFEAGTIALAANGTVTISDGLSGYGPMVNMTATLPEHGTTASTFTIAITDTVIDGIHYSFTINDGSISMDLASMEAGLADEPVPTAARFNLDVVLQQKQVLVDDTWVVATNPVAFAGRLSTDLVAKPNADAVVPSRVTLAGTVSNAAGDRMDATLVFNLANAADYNPYPYNEGDIRPIGAYSTSSTVIPGHESFVVSFNDGSEAALHWNTSTGHYSVAGSGWSGEGVAESLYHAVELESWMTSYQWVEIDGEGTYVLDGFDPFGPGQQLHDSGIVSGFLIARDLANTANNFADFDIALEFTAQLVGLPEASFRLVADRTGFESGNVDLQIAYGTRRIAMPALSLTDGLLAKGEITITNQDGVQLVVDPTFVAATDGEGTSLDGASVMLNGKVYATFTEKNGVAKITYNDATFEIL